MNIVCTFKISHRSFFLQTMKAGHLDYASLRLDDFATQNYACQRSQLREQVPSLCSFSMLPSFSALGQVFDRLVAVRFMHYCTSTPVLST